MLSRDISMLYVAIAKANPSYNPQKVILYLSCVDEIKILQILSSNNFYKNSRLFLTP